MLISYSKQKIYNDDIKAILSVVKKKKLTQGKITLEFQNNLKKKVKSRYCTVVNSCTSALFLAYISLGLKKNDIIWTTPITFIATINPAIHLGAKIDFVDINKFDFNLDVKKLEKKLANTKKTSLPKILTVVNFAGFSSDLKKIKNLSKKYKFKIIEDSCHSLGSGYLNSKVGSCAYSDINVFSFHAIKNITTGEGGALTCNSNKIFNKINLLKNHGIKKNIKNNYFFSYKSIIPGFNFRMTEFQAALGNSQLKKLDNFVKKRRKIAEYYKKNLNTDHVYYQENNKSFSSYHLFVVRLRSKKLIKNRKKIFEFMKKKKILLGFHYIPLYKHLNFKKKNRLVETEKYDKDALTLPMHLNLSNFDCKKIINNFNYAIEKYS